VQEKQTILLMFVRSQMLRRIIASLLNNLFSLIILNLERPQA
jgi:hypothetical protein